MERIQKGYIFALCFRNKSKNKTKTGIKNNNKNSINILKRKKMENSTMTMERAMSQIDEMKQLVEYKDKMIEEKNAELKELAGYIVDLIYGNPDKQILRLRAINILGEQGLVKRVIEKGYDLKEDDKAIILETLQAYV